MRHCGCLLLPCCYLLLQALTGSEAVSDASARSTASLRVSLASWNVYYKALDDPHGRAAIVSAIDSAGALDFVAAIEAAGATLGRKVHCILAPLDGSE